MKLGPGLTLLGLVTALAVWAAVLALVVVD